MIQGAHVRLVTACAIAGAVVVTTFAVRHDDDPAQQQASRATSLRSSYDAEAATAAALKVGKGTVYLPNGEHLHLNGAKLAEDGSVHYDPKVKNAVSRDAGATGTKDPTTAQQAATAKAFVAAERTRPETAMAPTPLRRAQGDVPVDRYEMAGGCYTMSTPAGYLREQNGRLTVDGSPAQALPVFFKATDLGSYLLHVSGDRDITRGLLGAITPIGKPTQQGIWSVDGSAGAFTFGAGATGLAVGPGSTLALSTKPAPFSLRRTTGCTAFPEITTNVSGPQMGGATPMQEVRGYVDAHTHGMAFEFLGGNVHCGKPWDPLGVTVALVDCPDHTLTGGYGSLTEAVLSGKPSHDPVGWPTFKDWPAPDSLTHEGTYYEWLERSWRAGQRILVNLLVENDQLCKIYPIKHNSCDDMDSIRLQAKDMRLLERYVDAQSGGPGQGWYRIVETPEQARQVINEGKLAVVMGIETSVPFGCTMKLDVPQCDPAKIDAQLDEVHDLGVRQMELVNKFDNALSGVAGDTGTTGDLVNAANFLETGSFWQMAHCAVQDPDIHDRDQTTLPGNAQQDAIFGAIMQVVGKVQPVPVYPSPHHCNTRGLTALGDHTIRGLAARKMIFDPDHMSVKARAASLDLIDQLHYSGVVSSHSWSTPDAYPRIYKEGGFITPYAGDSTGFVAKWKQHLGWADPRYSFGFGYGADINGLGAQGDPRPDAATNNPVTYPFTGFGGVTVDKQVSGQRVYDINKDGVAHYGLYPDWIEDLRHLAGDAIVKDMQRGPEAYLQMWERAEGITPNACANPDQLKPAAFFRSLALGSSTTEVLTKAGQPDSRLGTRYTYCASGGAKVAVDFTAQGALTKVSRVG
ncbi:MAG: hypothetical protein JWO46_1020 [Nocardioidaceae bacterium]|nr:hypothetical protein [Nocardioidaceae bacterium]